MPRRTLPSRSKARLPKEGEQIRIVANSNDHAYQIGKIYIVIADRHENGQAFRARDPDTGETHNWLDPDDVLIIPRIGWQWLRTVLPPQDVTLLESFDGLDLLTLKQEIKDTILTDLPTLDHHILTAHRPPSPQARRAPDE